MAKDAGFTRYAGLPGSVKTGFPNSPAYKSRYCEHHMNHSPNYEKCDVTDGNKEGKCDGAEVILAKKVTRNEIYYIYYYTHRFYVYMILG